uniref:Uncharacterized protein n=1 Tax=Arundo donax TaxID=35708 RepID=A0A0A9B8S6_ARUDO
MGNICGQSALIWILYVLQPQMLSHMFTFSVHKHHIVSIID